MAASSGITAKACDPLIKSDTRHNDVHGGKGGLDSGAVVKEDEETDQQAQQRPQRGLSAFSKQLREALLHSFCGGEMVLEGREQATAGPGAGQGHNRTVQSKL